MGEQTGISWADRTFNPWIGCQRVSAACDNCYAESYGHRFGVEWGPHAARRRTSPGYWRQLRRWSEASRRRFEATGEHDFVFGGSLCDVFDNAVPEQWRKDYFEEVAAAPHLVLLFLTKRPQMIVELSQAAGGLPRNVALGTTMEDQKAANLNARPLVLAGEALRPLFLYASCEPLLGEVDLTNCVPRDRYELDALAGYDFDSGVATQARISWVIGGGESGPKARPWSVRWARKLRDDARGRGAAFHWKQNGEWAPGLMAASGTPGRFAFGDWEHDADRMTEVDVAPRQFARFGSRAGATWVGKKASGCALDGEVIQERPAYALA